MTAENFYRVMIEKLEREPFNPFTIELNDGKQVQIDRSRSVAIRGGVAACSTKDCIYVRVDSDDVKQIVDSLTNLSPAQREWRNLIGGEIMRVNTLKDVLKKAPFEPFRLVLTDGKTYDIPHPDYIWVWGSDVVIGTREKTEEGLSERFHIVDLFLVSRIEPLAASKPASSTQTAGTN